MMTMRLSFRENGKRMDEPGPFLQRLHHHFERRYPKYTLVSIYDRVHNFIELRLTLNK